ncbi:neural cell adhesion molecule L1-like [Carassius gibelio]|uniref:neural cell adhesion molecule L1-like n=1 Tax=Carassius gibelio TaxID=101364 RepID=UPI00227978A2|nr:neural cell adhesion molecule L1-like [Carassius gibelio]
MMNMRSLLTLPVFLALIRGTKGQNPTVLLRPNFPQVYVGDDVTLICNREGGSKPTIWYRDGKVQESYQDYTMLLTAVTPENNGSYKCVQDNQKSDPFTLTVLELEPHAQLSPSVEGAVMTKGDGRNLVLQVDDDLKDWACYVLRGVRTFSLGLDINKKMKRAVIFAELKEAERATFWCRNRKTQHRSNAVTLKMTELMVMLVPPAVPVLQGEPVALRCVVWGGPKLEKAVFYKNQKEIFRSPEGTYDINNATQDDNGKYSCHATYRYTHISAGAARKEGDSDLQELKVIGGPAAAVISGSAKSLQCSCPRCPKICTSCHWYHTLSNDQQSHRRLPENGMSVTPEEEGEYSCRMDCGNGFSRFSDSYSYKAQPAEFGGLLYILVGGAALIILLCGTVWMLKRRKQGGSDIQESKQGKDKDMLISLNFEQREQC